MEMTHSAALALRASSTEAFLSSKQQKRIHQTLPISSAFSTQTSRWQEFSASASPSPSGFKKPEVIEWRENMPTNKATFIGMVIRDIRIRYLDSGKIVANSSIQVTRPVKEDSWFYLEFWGDLAEIAAAHLKVNDTIFVSGSVWSEKATGKDGLEKTFAKVVVQDLKFVKNSDTHNRTVQVQEMDWKELWEHLFDNPTDWFDCRDTKTNDRSPDFRHKFSAKALWLDNKNTPAWVTERLKKETDLSFQCNRTAEEKWEDFFDDPSRWWDNRSTKKVPNYPDFKHKDTLETLWIESDSTPDWVKKKLASLESV
ncbi:hypothetical protein GOP47_0000609 [Adiantum capillus-veneris]|uniref:Uncharacterized protein n=1 Tax=Adiantum capillus-veneris TaxID=13818 RepID=A0A9D4VE98_ADICA|nr:hypothetical protein GOP47_0000609 [Adiantum capillus-veneris]